MNDSELIRKVLATTTYSSAADLLRQVARAAIKLTREQYAPLPERKGSGIACPQCKSGKSMVKDKRSVTGGMIRRTRECDSGHRFYTNEFIR